MLVVSSLFVMGTPIGTKEDGGKKRPSDESLFFRLQKLMQNEYTQISDPGNWRYNTYKWSQNPTYDGRCIATKPSISCLFLPGNSCHRSFGTCLPTWSSTIALTLGCFGCLGFWWWFQGLRCQSGQVSPFWMVATQRFWFLPLLGEMMRFEKIFFKWVETTN